MCGRIRKRSRRIGSPGGNDAITRSNKSRRFSGPESPSPSCNPSLRSSLIWFGSIRRTEFHYNVIRRIRNVHRGKVSELDATHLQNVQPSATLTVAEIPSSKRGKVRHSERSREWSGWEAATWTGRPKAERTGSERIKSRRTIQRQLNGILRLRCASLGMTVIVWDLELGVWSFLAKKRNARIHSILGVQLRQSVAATKLRFFVRSLSSIG